MDEKRHIELELRLEDRLRSDLGRLPVRPYADYRKRGTQKGGGWMTRGISLVRVTATVAVVLLLALAASFYLREQRSPTPATSPTPPAATPTSSASPSPTAAATGTSAIIASFKLPCGTVTAYAAPSATAAGSVSLGTSAFVLLRGSGPTNASTPSVGSSLCVVGDQDAAGAFIQFSVAPMGPGFCGVVAAYTPASATAAGSVAFSTKPPVTVPVAPGVTLSPAQVSGDQCFRVVPDAQGTAQVTGYSGPRSADQTLIPVTLRAGESLSQIDIVDWFVSGWDLPAATDAA